MLSPVDIFNMGGDLIGALLDALRDPDGRKMLVENFVFACIAIAPASLASLGFSRYAKNRGRDTSIAYALDKSFEPFAEPRLNEAYALIRRFAFPAVAVTVILSLVVGSAVAGDDGVRWLTFGAVWTVLSSRRIFVEACLAFGAEPAVASEPVENNALNA